VLQLNTIKQVWCSVLRTYLCRWWSCSILFINASALVRGTIGLGPLLSNGDLNWKSFGTFHNLSPSIFIIDYWKLTRLPCVCEAICWDNIAASVIRMKASSSSINSLAASSTMLVSSSSGVEFCVGITTIRSVSTMVTFGCGSCTGVL
jgi:hypothetical protein